MAAKPGYKGRCKIGSTVISGMVTWTYTGSSRPVEDDSEFSDTHKTFVPMMIEGGDVTMSGNFLADSDAGQQLLRTDFIAGTEITDLKLYIDEDGALYYTPDSTLTPASFVTVTKVEDVGQSKAGLTSYTCTFKVSGMLKLNATSVDVGVETKGEIAIDTTSVTLIGELTGLGGHAAAAVLCYFEYGLTTSYGSSTRDDPGHSHVAAVPELFSADVTGLTTKLTYNYRAVAEDADTNKWYGRNISFTTA